MSGLRATVKNGRIVLDEPTSLPEGTVLDLILDDEGDDLDPAERAALHATIARSVASLAEGRGIPADEVIARLRRPR